MTDIHGGRVLAGEDSEEDDDDDEGAGVFSLCCSVCAVFLREGAGWMRWVLTTKMSLRSTSLQLPVRRLRVAERGRRQCTAVLCA
jgi:hypothetical protein